MDIEKGKKEQTKGIENVFNKIIAENLPSFERGSSRYEKILGHQTDKIKDESPQKLL
jgi:hypothetical protein